MEIEFHLQNRESSLQANKRMKRGPAAFLWLTVGQAAIFLQPLPLALYPTVNLHCQLAKQWLACQRANTVLCQQTLMEIYLSKQVVGGGRVMKSIGRKGKCRWSTKEGCIIKKNVMTVKMLINLAGIVTQCSVWVCLCVCACVRACTCLAICHSLSPASEWIQD